MKHQRVQGILSFPELRGKLPFIKYPAFCEIKIDGELNAYFGKDGYLINKSGKVRWSCPITEHLKGIDADFIGELFFPPGKAGDLYKLLSHQYSDDLCYAIFDITRWKNMDVTRWNYMERRELTLELVTPVHCCSIAETREAENKHDVETLFKSAAYIGYEGIVVKEGTQRYVTGPCSWVKLKAKETVDVPVVAIDQTLERMDIDFQGKLVGVKLLDKYKKSITIGDIVEIEHQGILSGGSLRHPVFKRVRHDKKGVKS